MTTNRRPSKADFARAIPQFDGSLAALGHEASITISRDDLGIPYVDSGNEHDASFGMGYACAQDRLWELEWYRNCGKGTRAEAAGEVGVASDLLFRRFLLDEASKADVAAMSPETLAMF
jgi:penicillin amidase